MTPVPQEVVALRQQAAATMSAGKPDKATVDALAAAEQAFTATFGGTA